MNITVSNFQLWKPGTQKTQKTSGFHRCGGGGLFKAHLPLRLRSHKMPPLPQLNTSTHILDTHPQDRLLHHHACGGGAAGAGPGRGAVPAGRAGRPDAPGHRADPVHF